MYVRILRIKSVTRVYSIIFIYTCLNTPGIIVGDDILVLKLVVNNSGIKVDSDNS